jgi:hypothetical protein
VTGQELCFTYLKDNTAQSAAELVRTWVSVNKSVLWLMPTWCDWSGFGVTGHELWFMNHLPA